MIKRLALSGMLRSGKDYVALKAGYKIFSFAEPIYAICKFMHGSCDKSRTDHRRTLQTVGQWGWGCHDENSSPDTTERFLFSRWIREHGHEIPGYTAVDWTSFGYDKQFWVKILLKAVNESREPRIAVVNCRYPHEREPLLTAGFEPYLVTCWHSTRVLRNGGPIPDSVNNDISETYARVLQRELPDDHVIWNDTTGVPEGTQYLTVDQFIELSK